MCRPLSTPPPRLPLASYPWQLDRVFFGELDQSWLDFGFFVCKFFQDDPNSDDDWQVVLIDDRLPCDANGRPAFCRSAEPNVYWAMVIEKVQPDSLNADEHPLQSYSIRARA